MLFYVSVPVSTGHVVYSLELHELKEFVISFHTFEVWKKVQKELLGCPVAHTELGDMQITACS